MILIKALKERVLTIKKENGYPIDVKTVLTKPNINTTYDEKKLPLIEIILGDDAYETKQGGLIEVTTEVIFRLVHKKDMDDDEMASFRSSLFKAIYSNSATLRNNSGCTFVVDGKSTVLHPIPQATITDLNMLNTNRIWNILFSFKHVNHTFDMI